MLQFICSIKKRVNVHHLVQAYNGIQNMEEYQMLLFTQDKDCNILTIVHHKKSIHL